MTFIGTYSVTIEWQARLDKAIQLVQVADLVGLWNIDDEATFVDAPVAEPCVDHSGNEYDGVHSDDVELDHYGLGDRSLCAVYRGAAHTNLYSAGMAGAFDGDEGSLLLAFNVLDVAVMTDSTLRTICRLAASATNEVVIFKSATNNTVGARYEAGGTAEERTTTVSDALWHYLAITWSASGDRVRVYLDGAQVGADMTSLGSWSGALLSTACAIGADDTSNTNPFKGAVQGVALWSTELTATEIADISDHLTRFDDVSADALSISNSRYGFRDQYDNAAGVGVMSIVLDNSLSGQLEQRGLYTPDRDDSPLAGALGGGFAADLPRILVQHTYDAVTYDLFAGWITDIEPLPNKGRGLVNLRCVDALYYLSERDAEVELLESETSDAIVKKVIDGAGPTWSEDGDRFARIDIPGKSEIGFAKVRSDDPSGISFDSGKQTFDFAGDTWVGRQFKAIKAIDEVMVAEGGHFFALPDGSLVFKHRWRRYADSTPTETITGTMAEVRKQKRLDKGVSRVDITFQRRYAGDVDSVVGVGTTPLKLKIRFKTRVDGRKVRNLYKSVDIQYRNLSTGKLVGVRDQLPMAFGTDYDVYNASSGGDQISTNHDVRWKHFATFTRFWFRRPNRAPRVWFQTLQVRGTPLIVDDETTVSASVAAQIPRTKTIRMPLGGDDVFARGMAETMLTELRDPAPVVACTLENLSDAQFKSMLTRQVFDLVELTETEVGTDGYYRIMAVERSAQGADMVVRWICAPYNLFNYAIVDQGKVDEHEVAPF